MVGWEVEVILDLLMLLVDEEEFEPLIYEEGLGYWAVRTHGDALCTDIL